MELEPSHVFSVLIVGLGTVAWFMIRNWYKTWNDRLLAHDERFDDHEKRHNQHDIQFASMQSDLTHIKEGVDEVKQLLNARNTG